MHQEDSNISDKSVARLVNLPAWYHIHEAHIQYTEAQKTNNYESAMRLYAQAQFHATMAAAKRV